jgi:hypothetical protein
MRSSRRRGRAPRQSDRELLTIDEQLRAGAGAGWVVTLMRIPINWK